MIKLNYTFLWLVSIALLFASCAEKEKSLKEYMTDSWETTYLKLEMPTFEKSDSLQVYEDSFDNNPERIAQSRYRADGTFSAWFVNKDESVISDSDGTWKVKGDSLTVSFFYDGRDMTVSYKIERTKTGFKGTSIYDWDNDGEYDDLLIMKTKRIELGE